MAAAEARWWVRAVLQIMRIGPPGQPGASAVAEFHMGNFERPGTLSASGRCEFDGGDAWMRRLLLIGFAACAFALAPTLSASAMPVATPDALGVNDGAVIQVKGGHGHRGGHGHHYGWGRGHHMGGGITTDPVS
jgi:hypothetical protein